MKRDILSSPRLLELDKKRREVLVRKIGFFCVGLLLVFIGLIYVSRINKINIRDVEILGNIVTDTEMVKATVLKELTGNYLGVFPRTNLFLYPKNSIKNTLADKFKRLKDIEFSIKNNKVLSLSLSERKGLYTWCGSNVESTDQKCYFLDDSGYIFDVAPFFSGEVYFRFYGNLDGNMDMPVGSYFLKRSFGDLISLKKTLETMNLKPVTLYTTPDGEIKIYLSRGSLLPTGPAIIFKADANFQKIAENLQAALTTEPLQTDFKKKYSSLLYIDLRFGNKVYYKFQ